MLYDKSGLRYATTIPVERVLLFRCGRCQYFCSNSVIGTVNVDKFSSFYFCIGNFPFIVVIGKMVDRIAGMCCYD